jgi:hypothetical protein
MPSPPKVILTFDRPIDIAGIQVDQVSVAVASVNQTFRGTGAPLVVSPTAVRVSLVSIGPQSGTGVRLTATAATGIVAVDDGGTWSGVTNLTLPFP